MKNLLDQKLNPQQLKEAIEKMNIHELRALVNNITSRAYDMRERAKDIETYHNDGENPDLNSLINKLHLQLESLFELDMSVLYEDGDKQTS